MHLLGAPALAGIVLVEAGKVAVVALVQRLIAECRRSGRPISSSMRSQRLLRPRQGRGEGDVEGEPARLEAATGGARLLDAERGQAGVLPAREKVLEVPLALAVADEDEKAVQLCLR